MTFPVSIIRKSAIGCLISLAALSCHPPSRSLTVVTGKVVYGTLAMEGAELKVFKLENGSSFASTVAEGMVDREATEDRKWKIVDSSRSGYHGSFRLHLAEGTYRIEANTTMRSGDNILQLSGALEPFTVDGKKGRVDQVIVELERE